MTLDQFPRYPLTFGPSPVHRLDRLTEHLGGADLWAKREDCNRCFWNTRCIGHWKAVVDLYGCDDFQPVLEPVEVVALPIPYRGATPELVEEFMRREAARLKKTAPPPG